jgi:hypothetical protein
MPEEHEPLSDEDLELLVAHVHEVIAGGDPPTRKALLQSLAEEIRVVSRAEIYPSFLLPARTGAPAYGEEAGRPRDQRPRERRPRSGFDSPQRPPPRGRRMDQP